MVTCDDARLTTAVATSTTVTIIRPLLARWFRFIIRSWRPAVTTTRGTNRERQDGTGTEHLNCQQWVKPSSAVSEQSGGDRVLGTEIPSGGPKFQNPKGLPSAEFCRTRSSAAETATGKLPIGARVKRPRAKDRDAHAAARSGSDRPRPSSREWRADWKSCGRALDYSSSAPPRCRIGCR